MKKINKPKPIFTIQLDEVRKQKKEKINNIIKDIKEQNLTYNEKLHQALKEEKTNIYKIPLNPKNPIKTKEIHEEWENMIEQRIKEINNSYSYYQKRLIALSELKTKKYIIERDNKEDESDSNEDTSSADTSSESSEKKYKEILFDDGIEIKKIKIPVFDVGVGYFLEQKEKIILEKMEKINKPNLNELEKIDEILKNEKNTTINLKKYKKFDKINIISLYDEEEKRIKEKMEKKNPKLSEEEKREEVLKEEKSTEVYNVYNPICNTGNISENNDSQCLDEAKDNTKLGSNKSDNISFNEIENSSILGLNKSENISTNETQDSSKSFIFSYDDIKQSYLNLSNYYNNNFVENTNNSILNNDTKIEEKTFNSVKTTFYGKNKLYDIMLFLKEPDKIVKTAEKYRINEQFSYTYPNDLITYYITESGFLFEHKKEYGLINDIKNNDSFINELGLHFCGNLINYENNEGKKESKKCCPNEFICKDCMKLNKEEYFIKKDYLININGRVAKINKGKYHCFGHFFVGKQIEDCINKFSCEACNILDSISNYYK